MAWIEVHQSLRTHPKVRRLAKALGVRRAEAEGVLVNLWLAACDHKGRINGWDPEDLAEACLWEGDNKKLLPALRQSGWVEDDGKIHDWNDYGDRLLRQSRERMSKWRKEQK